MNALYLTDSYLKSFNAKVTRIEGNKIILNQTAFYPSSGGQPYDLGTFHLENGQKIPIISVSKNNEEIIHEVAHEGITEGMTLRGEIDWNRRYKLMRMHTGVHILCAIIHQKTGALITGNQIDTEQSRIDLNLENFDREKLAEYFEEANKQIKADLPVSVSFMNRSDAENDPTLCKLAKGLPTGLTTLRIVSIGDLDRQADGGTHVKSTSEVGTITFVKADNKGKANRRVYFKLE